MATLHVSLMNGKSQIIEQPEFSVAEIDEMLRRYALVRVLTFEHENTTHALFLRNVCSIDITP